MLYLSRPFDTTRRYLKNVPRRVVHFDHTLEMAEALTAMFFGWLNGALMLVLRPEILYVSTWFGIQSCSVLKKTCL